MKYILSLGGYKINISKKYGKHITLGMTLKAVDIEYMTNNITHCIEDMEVYEHESLYEEIWSYQVYEKTLTFMPKGESALISFSIKPFLFKGRDEDDTPVLNRAMYLDLESPDPYDIEWIEDLPKEHG